MQELQTSIQDHLTALLVDPSPVVKRAVLHNISALCIFLGRQRTNDVLLSHMITYLNDRDWLLRFAFFDCVVDVAACAGGRSLEDFILPLMIQALSGRLMSSSLDHHLTVSVCQMWKRAWWRRSLHPSRACASWVYSRKCGYGSL